MERTETFRYDDAIVRKFTLATIFWGLVGMVVGLWIAVELAFWPANLNEAAVTFGRLRPVHTNGVIFGFVGNIIFAGAYHSTQRLCKARMLSDTLSNIHFWGWQLGLVAGAASLMLGFTQGKEYAELEWPLDIAIALVWVLFAVNFFGTLKRRRERHMYVALWFYIATIVTVALLHIVNSLALPLGVLKSYSVYPGVQDALVQWWYGHNAVAFVLTTPILGLMYYYLPKAANRPVFSYRLSILHFWTLVFIYIWAGPHHLHYTALPGWASTLGMVFSLMLLPPSWGGMINGLLTLRGAWDKVRQEPVLKFFAVAITFYGMSTFEGPVLAIKTVNALSHYTDWTIAHVHSGTLGWNSFMAFGVLYWLVPRLWKTELFSKKLANAHFWVGSLGIVLYLVPIWTAGITQGLMLRAFEPSGRLMYPDFVETVTRIVHFYWMRVGGGALFVIGVLMLMYNVVRTIARAPRELPDTEASAPALRVWNDELVEEVPADVAPATYDHLLHRASAALSHGLHRTLEAMPVVFTVLTVIAVAVGSLIEIIPTILVDSNMPKLASVKPLTPLELRGRDIYLAEGCYTCHSQMIRPFRAETERYGDYSKPGESAYDHPFQWGSRRIGPDLARVGEKYPHLWHLRHMDDPRSTSPGSIMPR
ncbi:MAG: cytochrome-c oxidase, cbb3-type subunit I, partial [Polyangiaceae bacterium]|nr:cytochrome-c oxidase, cbb3-type subunit I [Polyangiaceae bacterium]